MNRCCRHSKALQNLNSERACLSCTEPFLSILSSAFLLSLKADENAFQLWSHIFIYCPLWKGSIGLPVLLLLCLAVFRAVISSAYFIISSLNLLGALSSRKMGTIPFSELARANKGYRVRKNGGLINNWKPKFSSLLPFSYLLQVHLHEFVISLIHIINPSVFLNEHLWVRSLQMPFRVSLSIYCSKKTFPTFHHYCLQAIILLCMVSFHCTWLIWISQL